ncbi:lipoyl(octanoyl) transferase LipB [Chitiniphilus purpureus]|uniref:Octanoyltransferase n=1 Tax=Chitiniphilus purpureus TaxID=2981137 RepID=A0ABY6DWC1_9NEIS|nr:lipoyl(octanoyl) transferase LipB [Chitiniphilus sp. CD1]UXY17346.1 lipoyl(octanoyl) transferase LipB [Chitiniphilus sp. CD1]
MPIRQLGLQPYEPTWHAMQRFTDARGSGTQDEIWLLEHPPVFTLGQGGKPEHILRRGAIPIVRIDRGGQVTYHGPGQLMAYTLLDLRRLGLGIRELVRRLENSVIALLADYDIAAYGKVDAPGVYVRDAAGEEAKIAALGLRIRNGCCFHGLCLNVAMDLSPYDAINPCGYQGLRVTQLADFGVAQTPASIAAKMAAKILQQINSLPA